MKSKNHANLHAQLVRDHRAYHETGNAATKEERAVLSEVLKGIEAALDILAHTVVAYPDGTTQTVIATVGDFRPPPENEDRFPFQTARDFLISVGYAVRAVEIDEETGGFDVEYAGLSVTFEYGDELIAFAEQVRRDKVADEAANGEAPFFK